ncbi:hypothetical protein ACFLXF_02515 [Chloroflexota bacterium]
MGMEVGDWITLVAVIVALGIGVASILNTQRLQKQERKERLLNEIIEWAIETTQSKMKGFFKDSYNNIKEYPFDNKYFIAQLHELRISYSNLLSKTAYICNVTKSSDEEMRKNSENAIANIIMITKILNDMTEIDEQRIGKEIHEYFEVLQEYEDKLNNSANEVMDRASKLKAKET